MYSDFGWFLYVGGLPQETRLETLDGAVLSEMAFIHDFSLAYRERHDFYVVFSPILGGVGNIIGATGGALLQPDFMLTLFIIQFSNLFITLAILVQLIS